MLKPGDPSPDLSALPIADPARPTVIFFFPKAFTPVCTAEACAFRDSEASLTGRANLVGISRDSSEALARFAKANELPYPLHSDPDGALAKAFGAVPFGGLLPMTNRATFVVHHGKILSAYKDMFGADGHVRAARETLDGLQTSGSS